MSRPLMFARIVINRLLRSLLMDLAPMTSSAVASCFRGTWLPEKLLVLLEPRFALPLFQLYAPPVGEFDKVVAALFAKDS